MKPYTDLNGKGWWFIFWGDKLRKKSKKLFKKSARKRINLKNYRDDSW